MIPQQTFIIFFKNDQVYCTTNSYALANEIVKIDGLVGASIQQVKHITSIEEDTSYTYWHYHRDYAYDCTTDDVNDKCHKDHY